MTQPPQPSGPSVGLVMTVVTSPSPLATLPLPLSSSSHLVWRGFLCWSWGVHQCWRCQLHMYLASGLYFPDTLLFPLPQSYFCPCHSGIQMRERVSLLGTRTVLLESHGIHLEFFLIIMISLSKDLPFA